MPSIRPEELTPFGRLAVKLDQEFSELARVSDQISRVNVDSDSGLDEGVKILSRAVRYSESIAGTIRDFSKSLQEARDQAETATKLVAERARLIQQRRQQHDQLQRKLEQLKEDVKTTGAGLAVSNKTGKSGLSEEDKRQIAAELERLQEPMARFIEAAQTIKAQAARSNFKRLKRQVDSMIDSLQASRRKIAQTIAPKAP